MFKRSLEKILTEYIKFPVVAILGPRQSGKTTLAQMFFKGYEYVSFEDLDTRNLAQNDPQKFLSIYENSKGIIIDEFQNVPDILSYIQLDVDSKKRPGYFILTGSQNFLMNQAISQSLAGRVGILTLPPLTIHEIMQSKLLSGDKSDDFIFTGGYPRIYKENIKPEIFYPSYIQSYVERDVRQLTNVGDIRSFQRFMQLCAARVGQQLNLSELASVCGISVSTAQRWISILDSSYIIFLLQPYFKNYNKRITKSPKIYFYDTGLVSSLLGIESTKVLSLHPLRGNIFENFVISDIAKQYFNIGKRPPIYFWRDLNGRLEVDCIIEDGLSLLSIEIKSGQTIASDYFNNLKQWNTVSETAVENNYLIYDGDLNQQRSNGRVLGWKFIGDFIKKIRNK